MCMRRNRNIVTHHSRLNRICYQNYLPSPFFSPLSTLLLSTSLSLSLSLSHTHTHTHTHTLSVCLSVCLSLSLSHTHKHTHTLSLSHSLSLSLFVFLTQVDLSKKQLFFKFRFFFFCFISYKCFRKWSTEHITTASIQCSINRERKFSQQTYQHLQHHQQKTRCTNRLRQIYLLHFTLLPVWCKWT